MDARTIEDQRLVFGLDIGTRNVVGTVGYRDEDEKFHVIAQYSTDDTEGQEQTRRDD